MGMRLLNVLLVAFVIGALAVGAYYLGSRVKDDADEALTSTLSGSAAATTAESALRPALFAANAYFVDNSTYVGMTADRLRSYDVGLASGLEVSDATESGFCIEIDVDGRTFSYADRRGSVAPGDGC
ncbi:MAG: hypothetical protein MSC30_03495 [Gaiellaceae bacterium MAG52_C11]|nr:hypothetical protein [Candidatus Gaiellasilicea maunaloa]